MHILPRSRISSPHGNSTGSFYITTKLYFEVIASLPFPAAMKRLWNSFPNPFTGGRVDGWMQVWNINNIRLGKWSPSWQSGRDMTSDPMYGFTPARHAWQRTTQIPWMASACPFSIEHETSEQLRVPQCKDPPCIHSMFLGAPQHAFLVNKHICESVASL